MERNIAKYSKTRNHNFFVHPDVIQKLVHILESELMLKQKIEKEEAYSDMNALSMAYSEDK